MAAWRARNPDYHKRWREAHREGERARARRWKATPAGRAARNAQDRRRRAKLVRPVVPALPEPATGHELFTLAAQLVPYAGRGHVLSFWHEELEYDLRAEAVLAILEGRDPAAAVAAYRGREINWSRHAGPLLPSLLGERE
jgi:hypothetical protein